ncbi:MAG: dehydrogenase [Sphingomonadales bacterium 32-68-7]|nr:MAG: dehydrogenase [Sphingomonadales bacterium 12-68-11]OYX09831.1 MAG: dehydrogenase [Sphingomonadales bacterium 32-68-7]
MRKPILAAILFPCAVSFASCSAAQSGDSAAAPAASTAQPFKIAEKGTFAAPWALAIAPGTQTVFVTEKAGTMKFVDLASGRTGSVSGMPQVVNAGQGGLGDVAFLPSESAATLARRTIYISWAEAAADGSGANLAGAALGRGTLVCPASGDCAVEGLTVIWRQTPKVASRGHYSHKIAFSPDGRYLFLSSGERQQGAPAQDLGNNLGKVLRLNLDGTPAAGNPFAERGGVSREIWSYGLRNLLGLQFDLTGQLFDIEHGPRGGDEINHIVPGANYGWPVRSNGNDYSGADIPDHTADDGFTKPLISWNPVIAPGDFIFYSGKLWPQWRNQALIAGMGAQNAMGIIRVSIAGEKGTEEARHRFDKRLRDIAEAPDGSLLVIEDGAGGRLLHLTPAG